MGIRMSTSHTASFIVVVGYKVTTIKSYNIPRVIINTITSPHIK